MAGRFARISTASARLATFSKLAVVPLERRVEIRPFLRRHLDRVLEIERGAFARHAYPRGLFLDLYRQCGPLFLVAKRARRIVGYAVTCSGGDTAEVVSIAVDQAYRNTGVATALMRDTIQRLKRARVRSLTLMVRVGNEAAIGLYRRLGFRPAGRIARYYEDRSDGLLMRRRL